MAWDFQIEVIGCGDAYDSQRTNASVLIEENEFTLLIDCGPTVPAVLFNKFDSEYLDAIYITHSHPDHCLGLTSLLNWMNAKGRQRPLVIVAQKTQWPVIDPLVAFSHWPESSLGFPLKRQATESTNKIGPWWMKTAPTHHTVANLSVHLTSDCGHAIFYSGDGLVSAEGAQLAEQSEWVFLECETIDAHSSHGSWQEIRRLRRRANSQWRLYHIDPLCRSHLSELVAGVENLALAEDGERLSLEGTTNVT